MKGTIERLPSGRYRARKKTKRCGQYLALGTFGTEEEANDWPIRRELRAVARRAA